MIKQDHGIKPGRFYIMLQAFITQATIPQAVII